MIRPTAALAGAVVSGAGRTSRGGRPEAALRAYTKLHDDHAPFPALAEGLFEFAQFEMERRHFDEAISILNDALKLHPSTRLA